MLLITSKIVSPALTAIASLFPMRSVMVIFPAVTPAPPLRSARSVGVVPEISKSLSSPTVSRKSLVVSLVKLIFELAPIVFEAMVNCPLMVVPKSTVTVIPAPAKIASALI